MIAVAVCDDEPFMRNDISARLTAYMKEKKIPFQIDCFTGSRELLENSNLFDILFLDIQMDAPDGMETARILRNRGCQSLLIFITVLKEPVFHSFEVQAFDYLVKPLESVRFRHTLDRAVEHLEASTQHNLVVQKGNVCQVIPFSQIVYCEVLGRKLYIHRENLETVDYYDRMENLEKYVDQRFFRCHRSYLVNLDHVRKMHSGRILLSNGNEIPVSRLRGQELMQALLHHMKERRR